MAGSKFVKAYCERIDQYFGLEMKQYGRDWEVVNFLDISKEEARVLTSEIEQSVYKTHKNLQPCRKCKSRVVSGCSCGPKMFQCSRGMKYRFNCIYCSNLKIDLSEAEGGEVGKKITLSQGQVVEIKGSNNKPINQIKVGVGWDAARSGDNIDVDSSVVVSNEAINYDLVYFGAKEHASGCVIHHGDSLTGGAQGDDETIDVYLDKVPRDRNNIVFILNIYKCIERRQTFGGINNLYIKLYDPTNKKVLIEYNVKGDFSRSTGLVIAKAFRKDGKWSFKAIGKGTNDADVHSLARASVNIQ